MNGKRDKALVGVEGGGHHPPLYLSTTSGLTIPWRPLGSSAIGVTGVGPSVAGHKLLGGGDERIH